MPEVRTLPSASVTRFRQYYDPLRLLCGPPCLPRRWVLPDHDRSPPITRIALPMCRAHYPGGSDQVHMPGFLPCSVLPSPLHRRVGIRITTFEACSDFTHVTARWLAQPPKGDLCHKAPARPVTRTSRLSATRSNRLLSRWNLPPLATRAYGAHCAKSRCEVRQRAQPRGAIPALKGVYARLRGLCAGTSFAHAVGREARGCTVRPVGACCQWRKIPP